MSTMTSKFTLIFVLLFVCTLAIGLQALPQAESSTAVPSEATTQSTFSKIKAFISNVNLTATLTEIQNSPIGSFIQSIGPKNSTSEESQKDSKPAGDQITKLWSSFTSSLQNLPKSGLDLSSLIPGKNKTSDTA